MSLYSAMSTSLSGMNAQASRLATVGDNVSNAGTHGYKRATTSFASMVAEQGSSGYTSGGVSSTVRYSISTQGNISFSTNASDLAVQGTGFFVVQDAMGEEYLTRAGSFQYDSLGNLTNGAFGLIGDSLETGARGTIQVDFTRIDAAPSVNGRVAGNLNIDSPTITTVATGVPPTYVDPTPALNLENSVYSSKTSIIAYNGVGGTEILDVYYTKTPGNKWEVSVFNQADASANGFPYSSPALASGELEFDAVTGRALGPLKLDVQVPNGSVMNLDFSNTSQLAYEFNITDAKVDGRKASTIKEFVFGTDGTLSAVYNNGHIEATHRLLLASVTSPDKLSVLNDTLYQPNGESGAVSYGYPTEDFYGRLMSGALEGSNVDIADEFTNMIETQRIYTANSKTFQTGAEMLEILTNMKR
jgi:flagellar hook protein FlgE